MPAIVGRDKGDHHNMTRRDFQLIARTLKGARTPREVNAPRAHEEADKITESLAAALAHTNPRFDRARFLHESGQ